MPEALSSGCTARHFNRGYETVRYAAASSTWRFMRAPTRAGRRVAFEAELRGAACRPASASTIAWCISRISSRAPVTPRLLRLPVGRVLEADGYEAFIEAGNPFDPEVARRLARFIYSSGNSIEPGEAYRAFRGRAAGPEPMLRQRGLSEPIPG